MVRALVCLIALFLFQYQIDPLRPVDEWRLLRKAEATANDQSVDRMSAQQRQEFERRMNAVIGALAKFTEAYNRDQGQVWPDREAKMLRKALSELQKTRTWSSGEQSR